MQSASPAPPPTEAAIARRLLLKLARFTGAVLLICALAVVAYKLAYPTYTHRFRLTIEVETPEGLKTGSSVYEVEAARQPQIVASMFYFITRVRGDAIVIDLGKGRNLVALRRLGPPQLSSGAGLDDLALLAFNLASDFSNFRALSIMTGTVELPPRLWPVLVTFSDLEKPGSLELVSTDQTQELFGAGFRVRRILLKLTDEPPTRGIERRMPWLGDVGMWRDANERLLQLGFSHGAIHRYLKGEF